MNENANFLHVVWSNYTCLRCGWKPTATDDLSAGEEVEAHCLSHGLPTGQHTVRDAMTDLDAKVRRLAERVAKCLKPDTLCIDVVLAEDALHEAMRLQRERDAEIVKEWWGKYYSDKEAFGFGRLAAAIRGQEAGG